MYKGIIFDLDGTLLDTITTIAYYSNKILEKYGFEPIPTKEYNYLAGKGARHLVKEMLRFRGCGNEEIFEKVFADYMSAYNSDPLFKTTVFDGINELIARAKRSGMKLAVLSNKPHSSTVMIIDHFFEKGTFDICYGARDGVPLKPDPAPALDVAEKLGLKEKECIYVGDTDVDMKTGKNAGFYTVGVLWGFRDRPELEKNGADLIVSKPAEISNLF